MSVKCWAIIEALDNLAPRRLAENWDNVGLLVGNPDQDIQNILVTVDLRTENLAQARQDGVNLIITHHPFIFDAIKSVRTDTAGGKMLAGLLKADIALFSAHTNLDAAIGGVNDVLAKRLGLSGHKPLLASEGEQLLKLVVFVPESHLEPVRQAITGAGAGHIGNYSHCTFQTIGTGTFLPLEGTKPFIGKQGTMEFAGEYRLETILPESISKKVVTAMLKAHPYEEVAYDLYRLANSLPGAGLGRIGNLPAPMPLAELAQKVKTALKLDYIRIVGDRKKVIKTAAVCGGAGGSLVSDACAAEADVLITGDVKYHEALEALEKGIAVIDAGHFATEFPVVDSLVEYLNDCAAQAGWSISIKADGNCVDAFHVV